MVGFGRPAMAAVRDDIRIPGDHCTRGSGPAPDGLAKADFPVKLYFEFHHFSFRFQPLPAGRLFYNQPLAVVLRVGGFVK